MASSVNNFVLLPQNSTTNWEYQQIFFGIVGMDMNNTNINSRKIEFGFQNKKLKIPFLYTKKEYKTIIDFIKSIYVPMFSVPEYGKSKSKRDIVINTTETPIDINIQKPSYIVLKLDKSLNWQFSSSNDAVTMKRDYGRSYTGLSYIFDEGTANVRVTQSPDDGCRVVFFAAENPPALYSNGFNFHIEILQGAGAGLKKLPLIIDPEVKHPGGAGS
jgi:hypothetical protein